jgi:hypothetical protein
VAAHSFATIGPSSQEIPPGILNEDLWEEAVLEPFGTLLPIKEPHYPVLAALEGSSCAVASTTPLSCIKDAKPLFFLSGELICNSFSISADGTTYRTFFLPKICSPPIGLIWPTNIGFDHFKESIQALGRSYKPFLQTIEALEPHLSLWFPALSAYPDHFSIPSCLYQDEMMAFFPSLMTGAYPKSVTDPQPHLLLT